jgi:hypothetical protein
VLTCLVFVLAPGTMRITVRSLEQTAQADQGSCTDIVENGGFERSVDSWAPWVSKGFAVVSDQRVHTGNFAFWMGGYRNADDALFQSVVIPPVQSATLSYWWNMHSLDDDAVARDLLVVSLRSVGGEVLEVVDTLDNTMDRDTWVQASFDLSDYRGMSLVLHMSCLGDGDHVTSFFIDDVELPACGDTVTPTPTATGVASATPTATPTFVAAHKCFLPMVWREAAD